MEEPKLDVIKLVKFGSPKKYPAGHTVFSEGTIGSDMYIILKGSVDVTSGGLLLTNLKAGSFFGEMSLLNDMPRSATIKTSQESYLLTLNKDNFGKIVKEEPYLAFKIMKTMGERIRKLNHDIKEATKQISKHSKSFAFVSRKDHNEVLEIGYYEKLMHKYAYYGDISGVTHVFDNCKDINVDAKDLYGRTALMTAVYMGYDSMCSLLFSYNAEVNAQDNAGNSALMLASVNGSEAMVNLLLSNEADPNLKNQDDETALMAAAQFGHEEVIKLLIGAGADIYKRDVFGNNALAWACTTGQSQLVKLLMDFDTNLDNTDKFGNTALLHAVKNGHEDIALELIKNEAGLLFEDKNKNTALAITMQKGLKKVQAALAQKGVKPDGVKRPS